MISLLAGTPLKLAMGLHPLQQPCRFLQLRQTSCRYSKEVWLQPSYQLLQALAWQQSMEVSASWTMPTKQLKGLPPTSGSGTATPWQIAMHSLLTVMYFLPMVLRAFLRSMMRLATCLGLGQQLLTISRSTPSRLQVRTKFTTEVRKVCLLVSEEQTLTQLAKGPPMVSITFLPVFFQVVTQSLGQVSCQTMMAPLSPMSAQDRRTLLEPLQTSLALDSPQNRSLKPQQLMVMAVGAECM